MHRNSKPASSQHAFTRTIRSQIAVIDYNLACAQILEWTKQAPEPRHVVPAAVHCIMTGYWNRGFQQILNEADMITPDGMPLVWLMRMTGHPSQKRVYGPDLTLHCCRMAEENRIPVYLYGSSERILNKLKTALLSKFPSLIIAGAKAPPFRQLTKDEMKKDADDILSSGARIVLVGLGCPKQDIWIHAQKERLPLVMMAVGAAFQFISGDVRQAPRWMMNAGLEWLFRIVTEPRRVWKRHIINDPVFIILACLQIAGYWINRLFSGQRSKRAP